MTAAATSLVLTEDFNATVVFSIAVLVVLGLSPVFSALVLCKNKKDLDKPSINKKIGSLYAGCKHGETDRWQVALSSIFLSRRVFFVALTFCIPEQPSLQVFIFLQTIIFYEIYLMTALPYETNSLQMQEFGNEIFFLGIHYHLVLFTGIVSDRDRLYAIGDSLMYTMILLLIFNAFIMLYINISNVAKTAKKYWARYKYRKAKMLAEK